MESRLSDDVVIKVPVELFERGTGTHEKRFQRVDGDVVVVMLQFRIFDGTQKTPKVGKLATWRETLAATCPPVMTHADAG